MACDRFVRWKTKKAAPTRKEIGLALEDYLGGIAESVKWDEDRFFATLKGSNSLPYARLDPAKYLLTTILDARTEDAGRKRWIEVWMRGKEVDVITRQQDELTGVVADGFAAFLARFWRGEAD